MRKGKTYILAAVLLFAVVALAGVLAACGSSSDGGTTTESSPSAQPTSAADIAQQILGKAPSGLAKEIVDRGTVLVSTDANYAPQSSVNQDTGELEGFDIDTALAMGKAPRPHGRLQEGPVGDRHPRSADRQVGRLHRLHDDHA